MAPALASLEAFEKAAERNRKKLGELDQDVHRTSNTLRNDLKREIDSLSESVRGNRGVVEEWDKKLKNLATTARQTAAAQKESTAETDKWGRALRSAETRAESSRRKIDELNKAHRTNSEEMRKAQRSLESANESIKKHEALLSKSVHATQAARKATEDLNKAERDHERTLEKHIDLYDKQVKKVGDLERARRRLRDQAPTEDTAAAMRGLDAQFDREKRKAEELSRTMRKLHDQKKIKLEFDVDNSSFAKVEAAKAVAGKDITVNVDADIGAYLAKMEAVRIAGNRATQGGFLDWMRSVSRESQQAQQSIAGFDNALRGMAVFAVIASMQQLLTIVTALAAELVAVASSAAMAGAAIGGGLVAGAAQAIPAIGLLVAAFSRFAAIINAVQQQQLMQQQSSYQSQGQHKKEADSAGALANAYDTLKSAYQSVNDAQRQAQEATVDLTRARFAARRELEDMILAEKQAALAAQGAALSQRDARAALQGAITGGSFEDVAGAQLQVRSTRLDQIDAQRQAQRARQDLAMQQAGSALRPDTQVQDAAQRLQEARRQVEDAERAVARAKRGIDTARRSATAAGADVLASAGKLQFMLGQMTGAERGLYQAAQRLYATYKRIFRPITDIIVNSFTFAVNRVNRLIQDPKLGAVFTQLAHSIGNSMNRITKMFTSGPWVGFFERMTKESARNIGPLTTAFISIANAFRRIATAAAPIFRQMVDMIAEGAQNFEDWVGGGDKLQDFFKEGMKHLKGWLDLTGAILRLFGALIGATADRGLKGVRALTSELNKATNWVEHHHKEINKFFDGVDVVLKEIWTTLGALAGAIIQAFDPEAVKALGSLLRRVFIPALAGVFTLFGDVVQAVEQLSRNPFAADMMKFAVGAALAVKVAKPLVGMFQSLAIYAKHGITMMGGLIARISGVEGAAIAANGPLRAMAMKFGGMSAETAAAAGPVELLAAALSGVSLAALAIPAAIVAAIGAFVFLSAKFGILDDEIAALKGAFNDIKKAVKPAIDDLIESLEGLGDVFGITSGKGQGLGKVFRFVFVNLVLHVMIPMLRQAAKVIGAILGGWTKIFAGAIDIISGILTLRFGRVIRGVGKILDGMKQIFVGIWKWMTYPFKRAIEILDDLTGGLVSKLVSPFEDVAQGIIDAFKGIEKPLIDVLNFIIDEIINRIPGVQIDTIDVSPQSTSGASRKRARSLINQRGLATGGRVGMALGGVPGAVGGAIGDVAGAIGDADFGFLPNWMKGLGDWIKDKMIKFAKDHTVGLIGSGLSKIGGAASDAGDFLAGFLAPGGRVFGPGGVDVIPANLTRDEFVVTPHGESLLERITGVPGILNWLAGAQRPAQGFAGGGRGDGSGGAGAAGTGTVRRPSTGGAQLSLILDVLENFGGKAADLWNEIWGQITNRSKRGGKDVKDLVNNMVNQIDNSLKRMNQIFNKSFQQALQTTQQRTQSMVRGVRTSMGQLDRAVFSGLDYVSNATNKALKAFDVDPVDLHIPSPGNAEKKAGGGFIGQQGERGGDVVPAWLGRGEAVLNWAHQGIVEPALRAYYGMGLGDMFARTRGEHGAARAGGFAGGGYTGPGHSGAGFTPIWNMARSKFGMTYYTGYDGHSMMTSTGSVSEHYLHRALDMGNGILTPQEDALNAFFKRKVPQIVDQLIWRDHDQFNGYPIPGHQDHVHLSMPEVYAFDAERTAKILSAAMKGLDFSSLLQGATGAGGAFWQDIKKVVVKGTDGPLKDMAQSAINMVRDAANKFGAAKAAMFGGDLLGGFAPAEFAGDLNWPSLVGALFDRNEAATLAHIVGAHSPGLMGAVAMAESSGVWDVVNEIGATGLWQIYSHPDLVAKYGDMRDPMNNAQAMRDLQADGGLAPWVSSVGTWSGAPKGEVDQSLATRIKGAIAGQKSGKKVAHHAVGGMVGADSQFGTPVPAILHAGEWVLNPAQQQKLAKLMGLTVGKLRDWFGFRGGPTNFQGGGEPSVGGAEVRGYTRDLGSQHIIGMPDITRGGIQGIRDFARAVNQALRIASRDMRKKGADISKSIDRMFNELLRDGGSLDQIATAVENLATKLSTNLARASVHLNKNGRVLGRRLQPEQILGRELHNLNVELGAMFSERGTINRSLREAQRALRIAQRSGNQDAIQKARAAVNELRNRQRDINSQIAEQQVAIMEKIEEMQQARLERINEEAEQALSGMSRGGVFGVDIRRAIAEALGQEGQLPALAAAQIDILKQQQARLRDLLQDAYRTNNQQLAQQISSQIAQLQQSIVEATVAMFQAAIQQVETNAARRQVAIDFANRLAEVTARFGGVEAAAIAQGQTLLTSRASIQQQLQETQGLLAQGQAAGYGIAILAPLEEKISDLIAQLAENAASIYENTIAITQARIDAITGRQGFLGGVTDALTGIVNTLGAISGQLNVPSLISLVTGAINQLMTTGTGLRNELTGFVGANAGAFGGAAGALASLQGLHGQDFVDAISAIDMNSIINNLGGPQSPLANQFESLIQAIIDNEAALQTNTQQLQELNRQNNIQQFTSSAWQWFRQAIFTGMGGLLPDYQAGTPFFPQAAGGGEMVSDGFIEAHRGEMIVPPNFSRMLRRLAGAGSIASGMSTGSITGAPMSIDFATRQAATIQEQAAMNLRGTNHAAEIALLRRAVESMPGGGDLIVHEAEHQNDWRYIMNRMSFERRTPAT